MWKIILLIILAIIFLPIIYFLISPMPVVRKLRSGEDILPEFPQAHKDRRSRVTVKKDISYGPEESNRFDLYLPKTDALLPVMLWVHGGAFVAGDKAGLDIWATMLASEGYAVAAMNYTVAPEATYPTQLKQICQCITKIQEMAGQSTSSANKALPHLDMKRFIIAGDSAGAHMAAQIATIHTNPSLAQTLNITPPLASDALKAALLYCGPYDLKAMVRPKNRMLRLFISRIGWSYLGKKHWEKLPIANTLNVPDFVTAQFPPTYITDGNYISFEEHGRKLGEALRTCHVPVKERYFAKENGLVNHEYQADLNTENGWACYTDTVEFLKKYS